MHEKEAEKQKSSLDESSEEYFKENIYHCETIESVHVEGTITEKEKLNTAKQILFGLAILYIITIIAYLIRPVDGLKLLDICTTIFPSIATLILVAYFRQSH